MSKTARHKAILDLLDEGPVESQDSLQQRLGRKGFDVGQATLSRDIHELKLVKGPEGYRRAGNGPGSDSVLPSAPADTGLSPGARSNCSSVMDGLPSGRRL